MKPAPSPERAWPLFWAGLAGAALVALLGMFGAHAASIWGVQKSLLASVEARLRDQAIGNLSVTMDGQIAVLAGAAPTEDARVAAIRAAAAAAGPGGAWAGGVTHVRAEDLIVGAPISPFVWRATRRGNGVALSGYAPTTRVKRMLRDRAAAVFPNGEVDDQTQIAPGAPNADWADVAADALTQLAKLSRGEVRMRDERVIILGDGDADALDQVSARYRSPLPAPYRARVEINAVGEGPSIPDLGDVNLGDGRADTCQAAFARVMARNVINFETGSAAIDASSLRLLDQLASIALRCDQFSIQVSGHTDNVGVRAANMDLSRRRAAAVAAYLIEQGVAAERLAPIGFGPDRPRASNSTSVGQAANRRIEFTVSS